MPHAKIAKAGTVKSPAFKSSIVPAVKTCRRLKPQQLWIYKRPGGPFKAGRVWPDTQQRCLKSSGLVCVEEEDETHKERHKNSDSSADGQRKFASTGHRRNGALMMSLLSLFMEFSFCEMNWDTFRLYLCIWQKLSSKAIYSTFP